MTEGGFILIEEARFSAGDDRPQELEEERGRRNLPTTIDDTGHVLTPPDCHDIAADVSPTGGYVFARSLREAFQAYGYWGGMEEILGDQILWALDPDFGTQLFSLEDRTLAHDKLEGRLLSLSLNAHAPAWSPSGDKIAFGEYLDMGRGVVLWELDLTTGFKRSLGHFHSPVDLSIGGALTYSPDGSWLMVQSWQLRAIVEVRSGTVVDLSAQFESCGWYPTAGPSCVVGSMPTEDGCQLRLMDLVTSRVEPLRKISNPHQRPISLRSMDPSADGRHLLCLTSSLHETLEYEGKAYERPAVACVIEVESGITDLPLGHKFRTPNADRMHMSPRWRQRPRPGGVVAVAEDSLRSAERLIAYDRRDDEEQRHREWLGCEAFCFAPTFRGEPPPALLPFALAYAEAANGVDITTSGLEAWIGFFVANAAAGLADEPARKRLLTDTSESWLARARALGCAQALSPDGESLVESMRRQTAGLEYNEATQVAMFVVPAREALAQFTKGSRTKHDHIALVADHDRWVDDRGKWQCRLYVFRHRDTRHALVMVLTTDDDRSLHFNVFAEAAFTGWEKMVQSVRAEGHDHSMVQPVLDDWYLLTCDELMSEPPAEPTRRGFFRR